MSRINQIDAAQLDEEIYKVLRNQAKSIAKYQPLENIDRWQAEIDAVLKFFIWHYSLRHGKSTFGQQLLNLHYENINRAKSVLYLIFTVVPGYIRDKLLERAVSPKLSLLLDRVAAVAKLVEFVNLLVFLHRGTQPRVVEYLVGIASRSTTTHKPRSIGYSYMTRELLWHGLMELFTTGLPIINFHYFKHAIKRLCSRKDRSRAGTRRSFPTMTLASKCPYCNDAPILPAHAGCEHVYCYYCLKAHFTATNEFQCFQCGSPLCLENMKTYQPISASPSLEAAE